MNRGGARVEKFGKGIEVLLNLRFQEFLNDSGTLPQPARNWQADFLKGWQFGGDDPFRVLVQQVEELDPLSRRGRRFAQQK